MYRYKVILTNGTCIEIDAPGFEVDASRETLRFEGVALFNFKNIAGFIKMEDLNTQRGDEK